MELRIFERNSFLDQNGRGIIYSHITLLEPEFPDNSVNKILVLVIVLKMFDQIENY